MGVYALMSGSFLDKKIATQSPCYNVNSNFNLIILVKSSQSPCIKKINKIILMETH
jgi:hypothetical protein